ncbi:hypothetical protein ACHWQZ_G016731 [Mnemiopsis leidyi]
MPLESAIQTELTNPSTLKSNELKVEIGPSNTHERQSVDNANLASLDSFCLGPPSQQCQEKWVPEVLYKKGTISKTRCQHHDLIPRYMNIEHQLNQADPD